MGRLTEFLKANAPQDVQRRGGPIVQSSEGVEMGLNWVQNISSMFASETEYDAYVDQQTG